MHIYVRTHLSNCALYMSISADSNSFKRRALAWSTGNVPLPALLGKQPVFPSEPPVDPFHCCADAVMLILVKIVMKTIIQSITICFTVKKNTYWNTWTNAIVLQQITELRTESISGMAAAEALMSTAVSRAVIEMRFAMHCALPPRWQD